MTLIKICGITNKLDRDFCLDAGVDLLGFNFYPGSKRYVDIEKLEVLVPEKLRDVSVIVGVNMGTRGWENVIRRVHPGYIQMHGDETLDEACSVKKTFPDVKIIKRIDSSSEVLEEEAGKALEAADFVICDASGDFYGGSGKSFDWSLLEKLSADIRGRLFLAGGITHENVSRASSYGVYAVDIATGSESEPGRKSKGKVEKIVRQVKSL